MQGRTILGVCVVLSLPATLLLGCGDDAPGGETDGQTDGTGSAEATSPPSGTTANESTTAGTTAGSTTTDGTSGTSATGEPTAGGETADTAGTTTAEEECEALPTFERDIVPILFNSCGNGDNSCHARNAYAATVDQDCRGWLSLENDALGAMFYEGPDAGQPTGCPDLPLYERLLTLDAWNCETYDARAAYLVPCDPEASYLYRKVLGGDAVCNIDKPAMGQSNVPSETMPMDRYELSVADQQTLYDWIANGAPRDGQACEALCDDGGTGDSGDTGDGLPPDVEILHPSSGEERAVGAATPFIGTAVDPEDGALSGAAMVWTSDAEGQIGTGRDFSWTPSQLGPQTITLAATDSSDNESTASVDLTIVP